MKRDAEKLKNTRYDLIVIGGGITGASLLYEAALRGFKACLVEADDFVSGASSNSLKIIHGGLRYLQQLDFPRMRESIEERRVLLKIAPHLVHPLPCVLPTEGWGLRSRLTFYGALKTNDFLSRNRNRELPREQWIPDGKTLTPEEFKLLVPNFKRSVTGGALYHDARVENSEKLVFAFLHSATKAGADLINHCKVTGLITKGNRVAGVSVKDSLTQEVWDMKGDFVVSCVNSWTDECMKAFFPKSTLSFSPHLVMNILTQKCFYPGSHAFGVFGKKRAFFIVPWRGLTMIGTHQEKFEGDPARFRVSQSMLNAFLEEFNEAYPAASLRPEELCFHHRGFIPGTPKSSQSLRHFEIHDHETDSGLNNALTVLAVKYTTARGVAEKTVDRIFEKTGRVRIPSTSKETPLTDSGPEIEKLSGQNPDWTPIIPGSENVRVAEVVYAVQEEMARTLSDVLLRRTGIGSSRLPAQETIDFCARLMTSLLGWGEGEKARQIERLKERYLVP